MKNNILGFAVYLLAAIVFSPDVAIILLAIKENSDRCHYYKVHPTFRVIVDNNKI